MKKALSFALVLVMLVSVFAVSLVTTASAETAKEFVIDGNLDIWYLSEDETPDDDLNYYHISAMDAYNLDPLNGHGIYFFDGAETAAEAYMAYDDTYIYIYIKCWDDNLAINPTDEKGSSVSDSLEVWFDSDPNSQTKHPDGTNKTEDEIKDWPGNTGDAAQSDIRFRLRAADFKVSDVPGVVKPNYNGVNAPDYYNDRANLMPFYFENEPREVANGDIVSSGYGCEVRIPFYDVTKNPADAKSFCVNIACNNYLDGTMNSSGEVDGNVEEWYALAMGQAWWLDYSTANRVFIANSGNPFFDQDVTGKSLYYTENEYNAEGMAVRDAIDELPATVTVLEKAQVQDAINQYEALNDIQKGYVHARNYDVLKAAADKLGLALDGPAVDPGDDPVDPNPGDDPVDPNPGDDPVDPNPGDDPVDPNPGDERDLGDVNGDGKIDAKDALLCLRTSVDKYEPSEEEAAAADVNKDEKIDAKDALEILKFSVDKPSVLDAK